MMMFNENYKCPLDGKLHAIRQCTKFSVMPVEKKLRVVSRYGLCYNCLAISHSRADCKSIDRCRRCKQDHNSWLHPVPEGRIWVQMTAQIRVVTGVGKKPLPTLALIDPNTTKSSITLHEADALQCKVAHRRTTVKILHRDQKKYFTAELLVVDETFGRTPKADIECDVRRDVPNGLADRRYYRSREYSVVLGADVMNRVLIEKAVGRPGSLQVQDTVFGFAYFGEGVLEPERGHRNINH